MDIIKDYFEQNSSWWVNNNYGDKVNYYPVGENRLRLVLEMLEYMDLTGKDILDVGCGGGNVTFGLAQQGYHVMGVDRSQNMLDIANQKKEQLDQQVRDRVEFRLSEFDDIEEAVDGKKFDIIVAMGFIGYIDNDDIFFGKVSPLLKKDGLLLVSCRNRLFNMYEGSKYRRIEVVTGGAKELTEEIEELYKKEVDEAVLKDFYNRLARIKDMDPEQLCTAKQPEEKQKPQDVTLDPRQHTPKGLKSSAEKFGLQECQTVGVHPHMISAKYNAHGMPQIFKALSDTLCAFEKHPVSLTWSSVFISCFRK